jgi:hypothetical protein
MATQKHMGKNSLVDRLTAQVGNRKSAVGILKKRGHLKEDGKTLTKAGKQRDAMTAKERAIDRAVKRSGKDPENYKFKPSKNQAVLRNRK